jgi:hypothetical protein
MIKTSLIALATVATVSLAAFPAFADSEIFGSGDQDLAKASIVAQLRQDGVNANSVDEWDGYVRAYVTLDDGHQVMRFFEPGSLKPAAVGNSVATALSY